MSNHYLTKRDSTIIGGITILLMIWHHLFGLPTGWYVNPFQLNFYPYAFLTEIIAKFGNICIDIFAFISGYALWCNPNSYSSSSKRFKRLFKFLLGYWIICLFFFTIGMLYDAELPSFRLFLYNCFGLKTNLGKIVNVPFAWYVTYYIIFILACPVLIKAYSRNSLFTDICILFVTTIVATVFRLIPDSESVFVGIAHSLYPIISTSIGVLFAKYYVFENVSKRIVSKTPVCIIIIASTCLMLIRFYFQKNDVSSVLLIGGGNTLISCILILSLCEISHRMKINVESKTGAFIWFFGQNSMVLWFLHGIFFSGMYPLQSEIYSLRDPILIFFTVITILAPLAWILNKFIAFIWLCIENSIKTVKMNFFCDSKGHDANNRIN